MENEVTFSMNSIVLSFKDINWRPTYYVVQDGRAYELLKKQIFNLNIKAIFLGINCDFFRGIYYAVNRFRENIVPFPLDLYMHKCLLKKVPLFSDDAYEKIYDGYTVTYSIIQLAIYMGFKDIYLMGVDCDYTSTGNRHIVEYVENKNKRKTEERMMCAYYEAEKYARKRNVNIYNLTEAGKLDAFRRKNINDVI